MKYGVVEYEARFQQAVVDLILPIQHIEFKVPITIHDQPDLQNIPVFYKNGKGNFWVALFGDKVVGTIAIIDFGHDQVALRKMFVHRDHRGKENGVAQLLLDELKKWCKAKSVKEIFLGTLHSMHAAHRFYQKHGFTEIPKANLPADFPVMHVDNKFYKYTV